MIIDRILKIIELKNINKNRFYKETGLSNGFLDKVKDIGASKIELILNSFPDINAEWLITGNGEMLNNTYSDKINAVTEPVTEDNPLSKLQQENKELKELVSILKDQNQLLKETIEMMKETEKEQDNKERNRRGA